MPIIGFRLIFDNRKRIFMASNEQKLYRQAWYLSLFTIFYNLVEGVVSITFGYADETLALLGFGFDSFVEIISGIGIAVMVTRISRNPASEKSQFEKTALIVTGVSFYLLSAGLLVGIVGSVMKNHRPETTLAGAIISLISIVVMVWLTIAKKKIGRKLGSEPIIADGNCTKLCVYMSIVLFAASIIYELTGFAYADVLGTAGLVYFSVTEGHESFEKAKGKECGCEGRCKP